MARVFLSHASADKPAVRRIAVALRGAGHDPWLDEDEILVGESISAAVERGLRDADFVVICLSKAAAERGWVEAERDATLMQQFRERTERILPVRLEDVAPPYLIGSLAYVDLFPDDQAFDRGVVRLARSIAGYEERREPRNKGVAPERPTPSYANAEDEALSKMLEDALARRQKLRTAGISTDDIEREVRDIKRQLREGGQLRVGDALGDGRYLLVKVVGRGGFATVWEAYDTEEEQRVAIKALHSNLAGDRLRRDRFFRGARVMMELQHPAVVRVLDPKGKDGGYYYFVMELLRGGNLREAVVGKRVREDAAWALILRIGEALAIAHSRGIIHRDIKPANILLDENGNAKLTDFDLVGVDDTTGGTHTGVMGTVVYAAPECLDKPQEATARADVFSLGMTAIFCLAGQDLTMDTLVDRAGTLAQLRCSAAVRRVLERAAAWKPDLRFADAATMVEALRDALDVSARSAFGIDEDAALQRTVFAPVGPPGDPSHLPESPRGNAIELMRGLRERPRWAIDSGNDQYGLWATFEVNDVRQRMRWIPPGTFLMGSPGSERGRLRNERWQRRATFTNGYWLGETPVTQALWVALMRENPSGFRSTRPDEIERPVEQVSWDACQAFAERLNNRVGELAARLPSEVEWEHACRAETVGATWVGDLSGDEVAHELDAIAWYRGNSGGTTHPVGKKAPNPYGLRDMLGNVWEWCQDGSAGLVPSNLDGAVDPVPPNDGLVRLIRGGSWRSDAAYVRAASFLAYPREYCFDFLGFRLAAGNP